MRQHRRAFFCCDHLVSSFTGFPQLGHSHGPSKRDEYADSLQCGQIRRSIFINSPLTSYLFFTMAFILPLHLNKFAIYTIRTADSMNLKDLKYGINPNYSSERLIKRLFTYTTLFAFSGEYSPYQSLHGCFTPFDALLLLNFCHIPVSFLYNFHHSE